MVGILIALQINTWNQEKERKNKEYEILQDLRSELVRAQKELAASRGQYAIARSSIDLILEHMKQDLPYHDSLSRHFFNTTLYWGTSDLNNAAYEILKTSGLDLISNTELRDILPALFEENDKWIAEDENRYIDILIRAGDNIYNTRFYDYWDGIRGEEAYEGKMIPLDYDTLKDDQEFLFFLRSQKYRMRWLIEEPNQYTTNLVDRILEMVDEELDTFK